MNEGFALKEFLQQTLSSYLLGFALMNLFHGAFSDSFGRRPVVLWGLVMYSVSDKIFSGICISLLFGACGLPFGTALRATRSAFLGLGMIMVFSAWLQFINFDGSWPKDQPREDKFYYRRTKADEHRIWSAVDDNMSKDDYDDYHRCNDLNVCVRKFAGLRKP